MMLLCGSPAWAQDDPTPSPVIATETPAPTPGATYLLTDIPAALEDTRRELEAVVQGLESGARIENLETELATLTQLIEESNRELSLRLAQNPSLSELRDLSMRWQNTSRPLSTLKQSLNSLAANLGDNRDRIAELESRWIATLSTGSGGEPLPLEIRQQIQRLLADLGNTRRRLADVRSQVLVTITRATQEESRIQALSERLEDAKKQRVEMVLVHDGVPVWNLRLEELRLSNLLPAITDSLQSQSTTLMDYIAKNGDRFLLHFMLLGVIYLALRWAAQRVCFWVEHEESLQRTAQAFTTPLATGLLLTLLAEQLIYPNPPAIFEALLGGVALVPAVLVLRRILEPSFHVVLYSLLAFFVVDQGRALLASQSLLVRLLFTTEMAVIILAGLWRIRQQVPITYPGQQLVRWGSLMASSLAFVAANLGYLSLAYLVGDALLSSAYLALLLYPLVRILESFTMFSLRVPPLSLLSSVRNYGSVYQARVRSVLRFLGTLAWGLTTLDFLGLLPGLISSLTWLLQLGFTLGSVDLRLKGLVALLLALWVPYQLSRFARFILDQDVSPRLELSRGAAYTLSTLVHYAFLLFSIMLAMGALGIDTTKFTIVIGALGVGIGLGLQNIVNNFVSGLILLFERPIEVGHVIEVGGQTGVLQRIGLRASILRTPDGSEVIVPNGELLSTRVINWTLSDQRRMIRIPVGVAYGSSIDQVQAILLKVAEEHPAILKEPAAAALFTDFGESSLNFLLNCWTDQYDRWVVTRSEMLKSISDGLEAANIEIPFPHRTLHIVSSAEGPRPEEPQE